MATAWRFYLTSEEAWGAMYTDCVAARESISVEQYIFNDEPCSQRFFELFKEKARAGVSVRMLCDMAGSLSLYESPAARELREAGVVLTFFHPINPLRVTNFTSWFFRDHRKVLIVDDHITHVGGVGFHEKTALWRDTHVRYEGPLRGDTTLVTNAPLRRKRQLYRAYLKAIRAAKQRLYLTTPYFVPPLRLLRAIRGAARRGVDVRLMVPRSSDHGYVDHSTRSFFGILLKAGVRIWEYQPVMMHAKTAVVDDTWATVGSANLDNLSFVYNYEANLVSTSPHFVAELATHFDEDMKSSVEVDRASWERRSRWQRFLEAITWPIHGFL